MHFRAMVNITNQAKSPRFQNSTYSINYQESNRPLNQRQSIIHRLNYNNILQIREYSKSEIKCNIGAFSLSDAMSIIAVTRNKPSSVSICDLAGAFKCKR